MDIEMGGGCGFRGRDRGVRDGCQGKARKPGSVIFDYYTISFIDDLGSYLVARLDGSSDQVPVE